MGMMMAGNKGRQNQKDKMAQATAKARAKKRKELDARIKKEKARIRLANLVDSAKKLKLDVGKNPTIRDLEKAIAVKLNKIEKEKIQEQIDKLKFDNEEDSKKEKEFKKDQEKEKAPSLFQKIKEKIAGKKPLSKMNRAQLTKIAQELKIDVKEDLTNADIIKLINDKKDQEPEEESDGSEKE